MLKEIIEIILYVVMGLISVITIFDEGEVWGV